MSAVLKSANRDRPFSHSQSTMNGADVIQFPTSARTRRERQQLARTQFSAVASPQASAPRPTGIQPAVPKVPPAVRALPNRQALPAWLRLLTVTQRTSSVVTCGLVAAALTVYGWTVQTQQVWGRDYLRLEKLQQQERQIITASEALKHQLALQAEDPTTELTQATPENAIFLEPAPPRPAPVVVEQPTSHFTTTKPLGY